LDYQNNYVEISKMENKAAKQILIFLSSLSILHNYFDSPTKLFSDLHLVKFLEAKSFFPCNKFLLYFFKTRFCYI